MTPVVTPLRLVPRWARALGLLVLPLLELVVLVQVAGAVGAGWTVLLLLISTVFGLWLVRLQGARAWRALVSSLREGGLPTKELADGVLVLLGGVLLVLPGFVTDAIGVLLVLPGTRAVARMVLLALVGRHVVVTQVGGASQARRPGPGTEGPVVRGEVIDP